MAEKLIPLDRAETAAALFGNVDENQALLEELIPVRIHLEKDSLLVTGDDGPVERTADILARLLEFHQMGETVTPQLVRYLVEASLEGELALVAAGAADCICLTARGRPIRSKTLGQKRYVRAVEGSDITFAVGPAGTGKTFLAVAMAVQAFRRKAFTRIILTRPAVEAGEKLGFLPGDLQNKVDPYMRPLYDALHELMGAETYLRCMEKGQIEVSPLAYMRGRTLDEAFIILDEAQNTTPEQMKMFLTRLGYRSKAVVTGDITQIDLPPDRRCGLKDARRLLRGVEGISMVELTDRDVVRNALVQRIVQAYERNRVGRTP